MLIFVNTFDGGIEAMKLKPLADRVVLKQRAAEERTASGLFLASSAQEKPEIYDVIEVGPGGLVDGNQVEMIVKAGQQVLVGKYSGSKVKLDDVEYTIVRQSDILAVIE
jgi:chaperonin GroES